MGAIMMASRPADRSRTRGESILGSFGNVADVDAIVIKIEVERGRLAVAECE